MFCRLIVTDEFPFFKHGNYTIVNCGENEHRLVDLFQDLQRTILPAIEDARSNRASAAYTTFFDDIKYHAYVFAVLKNVSTGTAVEQSRSPVLFCPSAIGQVSYQERKSDARGDIYTMCLENPTSVMFVAYDTPFIFICPSYFTNNMRALPPANNCLRVSRNGKQFVGDGLVATDYGAYILLVMIAKHYIFWSTKTELDVLNVNDCITMSAIDSVRNGKTYAYYVASKHS